MGDIPIAKLTSTHVQAFETNLLTRLGPATIHLIHAVLSGALKHAMRMEPVYRDIASLISPPPLEREEVNPAALRGMAECLPGDPRRWIIDAGNDTNWGQVLVGNVADQVSWDEPTFVDETCHLAPAPTLQRPDLLTMVSSRPPDVDCAAVFDLTDQDPTINQMMASLVLQVVRRIVAGTCPFMALYLDMDLGTVTPTYITPKAVERTVGTYVE